MNVSAAASKWNVSKRTVIGYICNNYIIGISVENDELNIPDIPKPYVRKKPKKVADMDKYIQNALNHDGYTNYKIMGIDRDKFKERLDALLQKDIIQKRNGIDPDYNSTLDFVLTADNHAKIVLAPTIAPTIAPTVEVKLADQIGLVNGKIG